MAKTIQVRVDDQLKESVDLLFTSLGMDTSTAVRIFLIAAMEVGGIPFDVRRRIGSDLPIREAIARRKAGSQFYTIEDCMAEIDEAITEESDHAEV